MAAESDLPVGQYASRQCAERLDRLTYEVSRAIKSPNADAVHDLRVAIRRFTNALRLFRGLLPAGEVKKIRKALKEIMDLAVPLRERDIAMELARKAKLSANGDLAERLSRQRDGERRKLTAALKRWKDAKRSGKWRRRLEF